MFKKLLATLACSFALAASMALPAMAASGDGYYVVGSLSNDTTGSISVKVVLESKVEYNSSNSVTKAFDVVVTPMKDGVAGYSVRDAMMCLASVPANNVTLYTTNHGQFQATSTYIESMDINGTNYAPRLPVEGMALDGWMFRMNGKLPLISLTGDPTSGGPYGQDIALTPIESEDVIHFFWNYPFQETSTSFFSANYQTVTPTVSGGVLNVVVKKSWSYFDNNMYWHIFPFDESQPGGNTQPVLGADGNYSYAIYQIGSNTVLQSGTTNVSSGLAQITLGNTISNGKYYLHMVPNDSFHYKWTEDYNTWDDDEYWFDYCQIIDNTSVFEAFTV